ncbi:MAG: NDxxF motif lipoprotein [Staphylococcus epidermidis]|nr:NDxxF motif lipoprotein [Staphylococcus epidermidis]
MKKSIKLYLDKDEELSESSEYYEDKVDSEESLSQSEIKNLKHLNSLRQKNDMNFKNYIINNKLPKDYKKGTERISKYISHSNRYSKNLEKKLDQIINKSTKHEKVSTKDIGEIKNDSKIVNGREQSKIEKFLQEKNIKTKAFKK